MVKRAKTLVKGSWLPVDYLVNYGLLYDIMAKKELRRVEVD